MAIKQWTLDENFNLTELNNNFSELANRTVNGISWGTNQNVSITANPTETELTTQDLNIITAVGFYYGAGTNTSANKPSGTGAFGLIVYKTASGYITQDLTETSANQHRRWSRQYIGSTWSSWIEIYTTRLDGSETPTASNLGTITTHTAIRKGGVGRYKLAGITGNLTALNWYTIATLSANYRPTVEFKKEILVSGTYGVNIIITTSGTVSIYPRNNMNNIAIWIDETYTI